MLEIDAATVSIGPVDVLSNVSLEVAAGRIVGVVGPNGAGKTTLLDAVGGLVPLARGTVRLGGVDITRLPPHRRARLGLARTFQGLDLFDDLTVEENLAVAADPRGVLVAQNHTWCGAARQEREAGVRGLSHGERKAAALDRALAGGPTVLLLDEPAAGLDAAGRAALARRLQALAAQGLAIALADHDLDLVMDVSDEVCVLDFGRVIAHGRPAAVRTDPAVLAAYLGVETGPAPARRRAPAGEVAAEVRGLVAGYGGAPAIDGVDLTVRAGEMVALLGPNGAGKTTTLRVLSGLLRPTGGTASILGAGLARAERLARRGVASVPQDRAVLPSLTVAENLRLASARATMLDAFPALVPLRDRRAGKLSGGEQQLLALARALATRPRILLVDELSLGLAPRAARQTLDAVRAQSEAGVACVLAEQHPVLALEVADRAVVLVGGRCVFEGQAADLAARPDVLRAAYLGNA